MAKTRYNYVKKAVEILEKMSIAEYQSGKKINTLAQQMLDEGTPMTDEMMSDVNSLASTCFAKSIQTYSKAEQVDSKYFDGELLLFGGE